MILCTVITWTIITYCIVEKYINWYFSTWHAPQSRQNNIRNGVPILDNPTKVLSFMFRTLLVLKLLNCPTPDGGHLGFVQYGRHRGSPSWLPREIGSRWLYLPLVQKWCLWNDLNNYLIKPPNYVGLLRFGTYHWQWMVLLSLHVCSMRDMYIAVSPH